MIGNLVWLFAEHRAAVAENARLLGIIDQLERQLRTPREQPELLDTLRQYQQDVLMDQPYPDGKIPEEAWLTPGVPGDDNRDR